MQGLKGARGAGQVFRIQENKSGFCYSHAVQSPKPAGFCYSHAVQAPKLAGFYYLHAVQAPNSPGFSSRMPCKGKMGSSREMVTRVARKDLSLT